MGGEELCFIHAYLSSEAHRPKGGAPKTHKKDGLRYTPGCHSPQCKARGFLVGLLSRILNGEEHPEFKHPVKKTERRMNSLIKI